MYLGALRHRNLLEPVVLVLALLSKLSLALLPDRVSPGNGGNTTSKLGSELKPQNPDA